MNSEFSFKTRKKAIERLKNEVFDLLVIGGGITGASVAKEAQARGLRVALVEKGDWGSGTSSASSKLIHGGLRYLENFEFKLVFEALSERTHLLKTAPHLVRPLPFYFPIYKNSHRGRLVISIGLWLYDLLALFRAPGFHQRFSRKEFLKRMPLLRSQGLKGGFLYYDATMWDDVMVMETARSAHSFGAVTASYVEALIPIRGGLPPAPSSEVTGFWMKDIKDQNAPSFPVRARKTIVCVGPWTDLFGEKLAHSLDQKWKSWLSPSSGIHLVFDHKRFPVEGALILPHPQDGRIFFVIPRLDLGAGVTLVGTTDDPSPKNPEEVRVKEDELKYLFDLLQLYFPRLHLSREDLLSTYIGVRPLVGLSTAELQKVSREHHVDRGPGGVIVAAGGKYTTHRTMAQDIVNFSLKAWEDDYWKGKTTRPPPYRLSPTEKSPPSRSKLRYGSQAECLSSIQKEMNLSSLPDPEGFPDLQAQFIYSMKYEMCMELDDFYFRRLPLFLARKDHAQPWAEELSFLWMRFFERTEEDRKEAVQHLFDQITHRSL